MSSKIWPNLGTLYTQVLIRYLRFTNSDIPWSFALPSKGRLLHYSPNPSSNSFNKSASYLKTNSITSIFLMPSWFSMAEFPPISLTIFPCKKHIQCCMAKYMYFKVFFCCFKLNLLKLDFWMVLVFIYCFYIFCI